MTFHIVVDSGCNLTDDLLDRYDISALSYRARLNGKEFLCYEKGRDYEKAAKEYYRAMREGADVATSLVNEEMVKEAVEPYLSKGQDVLFISISSGVSGTYRQAIAAAESFKGKYTAKLVPFDPLAASFGAGMLAIQAAIWRDEGKDIDEVFSLLEEMKWRVTQVFTVEDLSYLKKGGRISPLVAIVGTLLKVKPVLRGNDEGKIVIGSKVVGRKKAMNALIDLYATKAVNPQEQTLYIAHADCEEEALAVAKGMKERAGYKDLVIRQYDLCTGTHVGPGTIAVFFLSEHR